MTVAQFKHLAIAGQTQNNFGIGTTATTDGGTEHRLWTILNAIIPPEIKWRRLTGAERAGIVRAGNLLHDRNIPYSFYAEFLVKFGKAYLKNKPLMITAYNKKSESAIPLLREYLLAWDTAKAAYDKDPWVVEINDRLYQKFPMAFALGLWSYIHSINTIDQAIPKLSVKGVLAVVGESQDVRGFWNTIGYMTGTGNQTPTITNEVLAEGVSRQAIVQILRDELKIRIGKSPGTPNPAYHKYFRSNGTLNARGAKLVMGE